MVRDEFGELRGLVEQVPSVKAFENLVYFIDYHGEQDETGRVEGEWLPYVLGRLEQSWPDAARECPKNLLERYESGEALWCPMIRSLNFEGEGLAKKRTNRILAAEHMKDVTHVDLRSARIKWDQLGELASKAPFGQLKHLAFRKSTSSVEYEALGDFFASDMLANLESLSFRGWDKIKSDVYTVLAKRFPLERLKVLDLSGPRIISPKRMKELLDTGKLQGLEALYLYTDGGYRGYEGMLEVLVESGALKNLRKLHISGVGDEELAKLATATCFESLEELIVFSFGWEREAFETFTASSHFPSLKTFSMNCGSSVSELVSVGLKAGFFARLDSLIMHCYNVEELEELKDMFQGLNTLLRSGQLDHTRRLALFQDCAALEEQDIKAALMEHLEVLGEAKFERLESLRYEGLNYEGHGIAHLPDALLEASYLERLEELQLGNGVMMRGVLRDLARSSRNFRIRRLGLNFDFEVGEFDEFLESGKFANVEKLRLAGESLKDYGRIMSRIERSPQTVGLRELLLHYSFSYKYRIDQRRLGGEGEQHDRFIAIEQDMTYSDSSPIWLDGEGV